MLTATDPLGHVTTNVYDANGNLLSTTSPSPDGTTPGSATSFTYDTKGQMLTITDPLNHTTTLTYTTDGLIKTITDAQGKVTTNTWGQGSTLLEIKNATLQHVNFQPDVMRRVIKITYPGNQVFVNFTYDNRGRRATVTDELGKITQYGYDDADRLISVTDPATQVTQYAYDTENNLTDITDAAGNHTHMDYNYNGVWLSKVTFPSGLFETYVWDNALPVIRRKIDRNGNVIGYWYDFQDRLWRKTYPGGGITQFDYDAADRLVQASDATGTYSFTYDNMNRLTQTSVDYAFDNAGPFNLQYGYDAASNRTSMADPQAQSTTYAYDTLNRLTSLGFNGQSFGFGYDVLSRRTSLTRPNGITSTYTYSHRHRLGSVLHKLGTTVRDGTTYALDKAENYTSRTDKRTNVTLTYGYDNLYQLLTAMQGTTTKESYTYDPVGNRLSSLGVAPYSYNSSNELTDYPGVGFGYDNNGDTLSKTDASGTTQYTWDFENRLTQVTLPGAGGTVTFKYDPFGRRVQKAFMQGATTTTNYVYDGANIIEEVDDLGTVQARYTQGLGIDEPLAMLRGGVTSYYHADGLGSITSLSNSAGALANTYTYDSFGKLTASTGTLGNAFRFTARDFDAETGNYYYRARYYDQNSGRFISEDPIGLYAEPGTDDSPQANMYSYALNNPVRYVDLTGKSPILGGVAVGLGAWISACRDKALKGAVTNFPPSKDKKRHCFAACYFNRCMLLMGPPAFGLTTVGIVGWEVIAGWNSDSWRDIQAGVWGSQQSLLPRSCKKICDDCKIQ